MLQKHILTLERGILDRSGPNKSCGPANFRLTSVDHLKRSKRGNFSLGKVCSICFSEICLQNFEHFWGEFRRRRKKTKALSGTTVFGATTPVSVTVRKVGNLPNRWKPVSGERDCVAASLPCLPSARVCALRVRGTHARSLASALRLVRAPGFLYCRNARAARSFVCNRVRTSPRSVGARRNFFVTSTATATAARFRTAELTFFSCG